MLVTLLTANGSSVSCEDTTELLSTQGPTSDEVDLIISAVNEWSLVTNESPNLSLSLTPLAAQVPIADTATNQSNVIFCVFSVAAYLCYLRNNYTSACNFA